MAQQDPSCCRFEAVKEGARPKPFRCHADAFPPAKYFWQSDTGNQTATVQGPLLEFHRGGIKRDKVGGKIQI